MLENLKKENFWNKLYEKYPKGVQVFCDWIDEYKKDNKWNELFNEQIKYHDLPRAMQIGIWIEFVCERGGCVYQIEDLFTHDWELEITEYIEMLQNEKEILE